MKTANELKSGIFAEPAMLLRGINYQPPLAKEEETAALLKVKEETANALFDASSPEVLDKGGPGSGRHAEGATEKAKASSAKAEAAGKKADNSGKQVDRDKAAAAHSTAADYHRLAGQEHRAAGNKQASAAHYRAAAVHERAGNEYFKPVLR